LLAGLYNLGVCFYQLSNLPEAITAWQRSLEHAPSPDAHTNLASAFIMKQPPEPEKALENLRAAIKMAPLDAEIR
jgi:tetratricopeptide (TPR) repeat protein